jgi:hypothetical protein
MCTGYWQVVSNHHKLYVHSNHTVCIYVGLLIMFLQLISQLLITIMRLLVKPMVIITGPQTLTVT